MASSNNRRHVVAIPVPTQGHVSPLLHLCMALASRGVVVTFVNTEGNQMSMKNVFDDGHGLDIRFETVPGPQAVDTDIAFPDSRRAFTQGIVGMSDSVEKLIKGRLIGKEPPVSCLLSDLLLASWPFDLARKIGVPNFSFWCASVSCVLLECSNPLMLKKGDIPVKDDGKKDKQIDYIRGLSPLPLWALPVEFSFEAEDPGFTKRYGRVNGISKSPFFVTNSFEELEGGDAFEALKEINPNSFAVGPLFLLSRRGNASLWREDTECLTWLDTRKPQTVLYISFGSLTQLSLEQFSEISRALEELQMPFLWAFRPKLVTSEALDSFKQRVGSFGMVVNWAPQVEILKHPSTGGFLTHCGWNSILEAIAAGVPMLCWPCVAEQNLNCKLVVEDWKIGIKISGAVARKLVKKTELVTLVKELMAEENGASVRSNMKKLSEAAHKAVSEGGSSYANLDKLVASL